jgi:transposase
MLAELVDIVIGVDTHTDTHTAVLVAADTRAVLATATISTDPDGYTELLALAEQHGGLRAWAIEGAGGYGAGLTRHLTAAGELVIELDRPVRPARRGGAKSDVIDAERAARDALSRTHLAQPRTGPERGALQMLLTVRRGVVDAAADAQRQLRALIITAPEPVRARFRSHTTTPAMVRIATRLRFPSSRTATTATDVEVITALSVLRTLARRITALETEAAEHERAIRTIVRSWRADLLDLSGIGPIVAATVLTAWSHPGRCRNDAAFAMLAGTAPIPASSGKPCGIGSTGQATVNSTVPCTPSCSPACVTTPTPAPTSNAAAPRARPTGRSNAASSATSPASSTASSSTHPSPLTPPPRPLDKHRSVHKIGQDRCLREACS